MSGPVSRKPLTELVRQPRALAVRRARGAATPDTPDTSLLRLEAANEQLARARQDYAQWKEESATQIARRTAQMETRHIQWMTRMSERLENLQQGRHGNE